MPRRHSRPPGPHSARPSQPDRNSAEAPRAENRAQSRKKSRPADAVYHATDAHEGKTLGQALRAFAPEHSWTDVRKQIAGRRVQINGNLCLDEARRLWSGDVVKVLAFPAAAPPRESDVKVRYLDKHVVVVEKPAGMTTLRHPEERDWPRRRKQLQPTLDETLPAVVEKLASRRQRPSRGVPRRLRAVHRLDRETSGLMVFARTIAAESALGKQFRAHELDRHYIGVCVGDCPAGTFESWLIEDRGDGRRGSTHFPGQGKRAITHVTVLERLPGYTVVQCRLETGRTHQIRIHLSEAGHPLCGDRVYRGPFPPAQETPTGIPDESGASRVALHAADLGLTHPITGAALRFGMPLPPDLVELIDRLRGHAAPPPKLQIDEPLDDTGVVIQHDDHGPASRDDDEEFDEAPSPPRAPRPPQRINSKEAALIGSRRGFLPGSARDGRPASKKSAGKQSAGKRSGSQQSASKKGNAGGRGGMGGGRSGARAAKQTRGKRRK